MRIDKKIAKHINNHGNVVSGYSEMCKILVEDTTSGEGKRSQFEKWRMYFNFEKSGHKFIIKEVYDEKTIKSNEKEREKAKETKATLARSKYRDQLIPVILYLLNQSPDNSIFVSKLDFAISCGFFNHDMAGKRTLEKYEEHRAELKTKIPDKIYYTTDMDEFTYCVYYNQLKNNAYKTIIGALEVLKKLEVIEYKIVNVGINIRNGNSELSMLLKSEEEQFKRCKEQACQEVLPLYNSVSKVKKESITPRDFLFKHNVREAYYTTLNKIVSKELGYDMVIEYFSIYLLNSDSSKVKGFNRIDTGRDYLEIISDINDIFVSGLKDGINKTIIKKKNYYTYAREISLASKESYASTKDGKEEIAEEKKYYNKAEIIDTLVSMKGDIDVMNMNEFEEKYYDKDWANKISPDEDSDSFKDEEKMCEDNWDFLDEEPFDFEELLRIAGL